MPQEGTLKNIVNGLAKIGLVLRHHAWRRSGRRGLTPTQSQILALLQAHPGGVMSLSSVAMNLAVTAATASDAVSALLAKGLIRKTRDPHDARAVLITLTAKGKREAVRASEWPDFLLSAVDSLSPSEQENFLLALIKMVRSLQEQGRIPVARMCVNCSFFIPNRYAGAAQPHHCAFVDAPIGPGELRLDCPDFDAAPGPEQSANYLALFNP